MSVLTITPYKPEHSYTSNDCFRNTARKGKACGGSDYYGYCFCVGGVTAPEQILYACTHAVWQSPEGELIDITPHFDPKPKWQDACGPDDSHLFFLPDPPDKQLLNKLGKCWALTQNESVKKAVRLSNRDQYAYYRACERCDFDTVKAIEEGHDMLRHSMKLD